MAEPTGGAPLSWYYRALAPGITDIFSSGLSDAQQRAIAIETAGGGANAKTPEERARYREQFFRYIAQAGLTSPSAPRPRAPPIYSPPTGLPDLPAVDLPSPPVSPFIGAIYGAVPQPSAPPRRPRPPARRTPKPPPRRYPRRPLPKLPKLPDIPKFPRVPRGVPAIVAAEVIGRGIAKVVEWDQRRRIDNAQDRATSDYERRTREFRIGIENENRRIDEAARNANRKQALPTIPSPAIESPGLISAPVPAAPAISVPTPLPTPPAVPASSPVPVPSPTPAPVPGPNLAPYIVPFLRPWIPAKFQPFLQPRSRPAPRPARPGGRPGRPSPLTPLNPGRLTLPQPSPQPQQETCQTTCRKQPTRRRKKRKDTKKVCYERKLTKKQLAANVINFAKRKLRK